MNSNRESILYVGSMVTVGIAIISVLLVTYWLTWPYKTVQFKGTTLPVVKKQIWPGENLQVKMSFTKFTELPATVGRAFINDVIYSMPSVIASRCSGTYSFEGSSIKIPSELPPGIYTVRHSYSYDVNPLRTITVVINTDLFEVMPSRNGSGKGK